MIGTSRSRAGDAVLVFLLPLFACGYFSHHPVWNGLSRLALVYAVVEAGTLSIDRFHEWTGDKTLVDGRASGCTSWSWRRARAACCIGFPRNLAEEARLARQFQ